MRKRYMVVRPSSSHRASDPPDASLLSTLRLWRAFELWFLHSPSDLTAEFTFQRQASRWGLSASAPQPLTSELLQLLLPPSPHCPWSQPFPAAASSLLEHLALDAGFCLTSFVFFPLVSAWVKSWLLKEAYIRCRADSSILFVLTFGIWKSATTNSKWTEWLLPLFDHNVHESRIILSFVSLRLVWQMLP